MRKLNYPVEGPEAIGIDVGGVIIDRANDGTDTSFFTDNFMATTPVEGVFEAIRRLHDERFGEAMYIVSKAAPKTAGKTRLWLAHHDFYARTGMKEENVHFCLTRPEKAPLCSKLGITHFIDDHLEVHDYLQGVVDHRFLFVTHMGHPTEGDHVPKKWAPGEAAIEVNGWRGVLDALLD